MKIIQARRERSDKISKIMGDYLLKGYKMLGTVCSVCETILLEDKSGLTYCIACRELDTDADKDDPVVNEAAARTQVAERSRTVDMAQASETERQEKLTSSRLGDDRSLTSISHLDVPPEKGQTVASTSFSGSYSEAVDALCQKIKLATDELKQTSSVEYSIQLCNLIRASADAIQSVKSIQS